MNVKAIVVRHGQALVRPLWPSFLCMLVGLTFPSVLFASTLTAEIEKALAEEPLVGATWALVTPEGTSVGAAGWNDRLNKRQMSPDNRVHVGSVAKALVATGVLQLVSAKRIDLDAPVSLYLPGVSIKNPWGDSAPLRVRHLLDHTSGLDDARLWQVFSLRAKEDSPLILGVGGESAKIAVRHPPGERTSYSNTGYLLLGMVIEAVTAQRYESWLNENLLKPLGMTRSTFHFVTQEGEAADPSLAMGHFDPDTPAATAPTYLRPAVQFTTTAADMGRFAQFLMSDGLVDGRVLVDSELLHAMGKPTATEAARAGLQVGYSLGLVRRDRHGLAGLCHLGNMGTFRSAMCVYPDQQRAFFIAYNSDPEGGSFDRIDGLLVQALGLEITLPKERQTPSVDPDLYQGWYLPQPNRFAQFTYLDELAGLTQVSWTGENLLLEPLGGEARTLGPVGEALFRAEDRSEASHVLLRSAEGEFVISDGQRSFVRQSPASIALRWLGALLGLAGFSYFLLVGGIRTMRALWRRQLKSEPLRWPTMSVWLLVLTPLMYIDYSYITIGDPTPPNVVLALVSALLPLTVLIGIYHWVLAGVRTAWAYLDMLALLGAAQWCGTLIFNHLLPVVLWQ